MSIREFLSGCSAAVFSPVPAVLPDRAGPKAVRLVTRSWVGQRTLHPRQKHRPEMSGRWPLHRILEISSIVT